MIVFKEISWKNFLSTGQVVNTVQLDKAPTTLIVGKNGEGKSTILDALCFALFGKPFRNINKGQLINSINGKNCLVEVTFETNGHVYQIKRGIKPNVFEIWCDGTLVNQDAALKDYQKVLEQQVLKFNYKTFTQVVILGSATFVPFMQLPALQRREVIEDILDIKVFSVMNSILKEKVAGVKEQIQKTENDLITQKARITSQKKLIEVLESNRQAVISGIQQKININNLQIQEAQLLVDSLTEQMEGIRSKANDKEVSDALTSASTMRTKVKSQIDHCNHTVEFFNNNTSCPTCMQEIGDQHKRTALAEIEKKIQTHQEKLTQVQSVVDKLNKQLEKAKGYADQLRDLSIAMSTQTQKITLLNEQNQTMLAEVSAATDDVSNLNEEKQKMRQMAEDAIELVNLKSQMLDEKQLHEVASALLKDTGIKTAIIREYLPVMNKLINNYLSAMDFFVKVELDESFQETIMSRGRDAFTYASFSEGEKRRLDLAILFTWRQIAKMKNSVNTNLMLLDEILDGALDGAGIDYFLSTLDQMGEHTNVFVISHRELADKFHRVLRVQKKNDFSVMVEEH